MCEHELTSVAERVVHELSHELVDRFGWTSLDVRVVASREDHRMLVNGAVPTWRTRSELERRLRRILPLGWRLDLADVREWRTGRYRTLTSPIRLWRALPGHGARLLASELEPDDGPVELIESADGASLVRGIDATLGWTEDALGEPSLAPRIAPARLDLGKLGAELERWLGAPYLLGGTRPGGVDCSGLVQRCFRSALGVVLPRHSTDQLGFAERAAPESATTGDLVFVWTEREGLCHVGVVRQSSIVHASLSRRRVVADPSSELTRGARRVERVPLAALLREHERFVGAPSIELPKEPKP